VSAHDSPRGLKRRKFVSLFTSTVKGGATTFTRDAIKEATRDGAPPIDLIDGEQLVQRLKELGLGVKITMIESVEIDTNWFTKI
jgi:restriction endonuclease Mrr